jgi:hypothetical protein
LKQNIRALPFTKEVDEFLAKYDQVFVVEMNRDGQMHQILLTEYARFAPNLKSVAFGDGMPASAKWVREGILAKYIGGKQKTVSGKKKVVKKTAAKKVAPGKKASAKKVTKKAVAGQKSKAKRK